MNLKVKCMVKEIPSLKESPRIGRNKDARLSITTTLYRVMSGFHNISNNCGISDR